MSLSTLALLSNSVLSYCRIPECTKSLSYAIKRNNAPFYYDCLIRIALLTITNMNLTICVPPFNYCRK